MRDVWFARKDREYERSVVWLGVAVAGALMFFGMAAQVEGDVVGPLELDLFRALNDLPRFISAIFWVPMQFGNFLIVPIGLVAALVFREWRLAGALAMAGAGKYQLARVIKDEWQRHRPAVFLEDVKVGIGSSDSGLSFVSGHATIAIAVATVVHPYLQSRTARIVLWALAVLVCFGRVLVGAHFPMDTFAGAGVGLAIGGVANVLLGTPRRAEVTMSETEGRR